MSGKKKVMMVEDNPDCREILATMIRLMDYDVIFPGTNSAEDTVDVIVVYLDFPQLRTVRTIKALRDDATTKEVPIVAFIPWAYDEGATAARDAGANDVMIGPITMEALRAGIEKYAPDTSEPGELTIDMLETTDLKDPSASEAIKLDAA